MKNYILFSLLVLIIILSVVLISRYIFTPKKEVEIIEKQIIIEKPGKETIKIISNPNPILSNPYLPLPAPYYDLAGNYYFNENPYRHRRRK